MTASPAELELLKRRAERSLHGVSVERLTETCRRAIVGPPPHQMSQFALEALQILQEGRRPLPEQVAALEYAIRLFRPAPFVKDMDIDDLPDDGRAVFPGWSAFGAKVRPYLRSVGRIDRIVDADRTTAIGTGFLITPTALVTNRHVVWQLSHGGDIVRPGEVLVRFRHDRGSGTEPPVKVVRVEALHKTLDLAVLRLETPPSSERSSLRLSHEKIQVGQAVVAIGFSLDDPRNPVFVPLLFGHDFGVKRAAVGEIVGRQGTSLFHDCTTLGGNSGSPLLAMDSAEVVGVHSDGLYLYRNEAIAAQAGAAFLGAFAGEHQ